MVAPFFTPRNAFLLNIHFRVKKEITLGNLIRLALIMRSKLIRFFTRTSKAAVTDYVA